MGKRIPAGCAAFLCAAGYKCFFSSAIFRAAPAHTRGRLEPPALDSSQNHTPGITRERVDEVQLPDNMFIMPSMHSLQSKHFVNDNNTCRKIAASKVLNLHWEDARQFRERRHASNAPLENSVTHR